jgi:hypothetical protein
MNAKSIVIVGRRWFNKNTGNTYFSSQIFVDGNLVHTIDYEYGYGNQYCQSSQEWLDKNGYLPGLEHNANGSFESLWNYAERKGMTINYTATDVSRKKDL